jgi:phosphoesterase family protein/KAP-like P-loop domain-containing protein
MATAAPMQIQHVVIIVKESHSFDSYFGRFPGADGDATLAPALDPPDRDYPHSHEAWLNRATTASRHQYSESDIPSYFQYARQFTLCDHYFSEVTGPATPNHLMLIGADSPIIRNPSPRAPEGPFDLPSLPGSLEAAGLSWKNYGGYAFPYFKKLRRSPFNVTSVQFAQDASAGNLPSVSWVYPDSENDEHPPLTRSLGGGSVRKGMRWTVDQIDAIVQGGLWPEVAIFITWDMYGGWADHVEPPLIEPWKQDGTQFRYGSRVPCLVLSPYARPGYISTSIHSHVSLIAYCEHLFGLEPLNERTATADPMSDCFDMHQAPLPPPRARGYQPESRIATDIWATQDRLGREIYVNGIAQFIQHADTRPPLTIGISAPWGAGKTSLMRMIREKIDPQDADGNRTKIRVREGVRRQLFRPASIRPFERIRAALGNLVQPAVNDQSPDPDTVPTESPDGTIAGSTPRMKAASPTVATALQNSRLVSQRIISAEHVDLESAAIGALPTPDASKLRPTVWFNPWMYETGEQIWAGLAHEIITQVSQRMEPVEREYFWLALNLSRVDRSAIRRRIYQALFGRLFVIGLLLPVVLVLAIGMALLGLTRVAGFVATGGTLLTAILAIVRTLDFRSTRLSETFPSLIRQPSVAYASSFASEVATGITIRDPEYESRTGFLWLVQTDMKSVLDLVAKEDHPLVVFVDDLDRCSSTAVAQVIEAINLFLAGEFPNCIFVLALDPDVVAADIEIANKDLVDKLARDSDADQSTTLGWRFLDKIVQLPVRLPAEPSLEGLGKYLDSLVRPTGLRSDSIEQHITGQQEARQVAAPAPAIKTQSQIAQTALTGGGPAQRGAPAATPQRVAGDPGIVAKLAAQIRNRQPGVGDINEVAGWAQTTLLGLPPNAPLGPETREAARQVYSELFRDENTELREMIVKAVSELPTRNPRAIKRVINLFRFYAFIAAERQFAGLSAPDLHQSAKLAILTVRWPQLLGTLGRQGDDGQTWLKHFELVAQMRTATRAKPVAGADNRPKKAPVSGRRAWLKELRKAGLLLGAQDSALDDLETFLASEIIIGDVAQSLI